MNYKDQLLNQKLSNFNQKYCKECNEEIQKDGAGDYFGKKWCKCKKD